MQVTKQIKFCAAHRLLGHKGKCQNIHGHNYLVEIVLENQELNELGMVLDFTDIKETYGKWIDENFDHAIIINQKDFTILKMLQGKGFKKYIMDNNPTAENMVRLLKSLKFEGQNVKTIKVWETDTSKAEETIE